MGRIKAWKLKRETLRIWYQIVGLFTGVTWVPSSKPAQRDAADVLPPSVESTIAPRCAVVAMVRNEADRAHEIMRHFCALFDRVVVIDHLSTDDTARIIAGYDGQADCSVTVLRSNEPGYYQSDYMTACVRGLVEAGVVDWIFPLDFDEFLPFASRPEFHQALVQVAHSDVIHGHWLNCVPLDPAAPIRNGIRVVTAEQVSRYVKVAVNARRVRGREVTVEQGNHAVSLDGDRAPRIGERAFAVLHFPIVTVEKLERKVREGVAAYDATRGGAATDGFHWREMHRRLEVLKDDPEVLAEIVLRYGEPLESVFRDHAADPPARVPRREFQAGFAQIAAVAPAEVVTPVEVDRATLSRGLRDLLQGDGAVDRSGSACWPGIYGRLPPPDGDQVPTADEAWMIRAILAGTRQLEVVVPTAWAGHEPFLFTLMEVMRPRRYVELGTHAGHSFFMACQHYRSHGDYGEAVAIDLWEGDHQAGFYGEKVFEEFRKLLRRHYASCGRYIRGRFAEAVAAFEPHSIDLLHIDGLHTYAAVREDYETWRPKLTDQGVVLFHDTAEYQSDFGVWQFFDEIRREATESFNFRHGHGLGVLAFGPESAPAVRLLRRFRADPVLFERHYAIVGGALFESRRAAIESRSRRRRAA